MSGKGLRYSITPFTGGGVTGPRAIKRPKIDPAEGGGNGYPSTPATLLEGRCILFRNYASKAEL